MARRSRTGDPESIKARLLQILVEFESHLKNGTLRAQVQALVPAYHTLRDLGGSLLPRSVGSSGRARILAYLRAHVGVVISGDELMVVAGIGDYPRRIRELRKQDGWPIISGAAVIEMRRDAEAVGILFEGEQPPAMKTDDYFLTSDTQDRAAAHRWHVANRIRKSKGSVKSKILQFLKENLKERVTSEELRYVANDRSEWARRVRELRTEDGWPVVTRQSGDPTLPVGTYVLAEDRQAPAHDRHIPELVRREVLARDDWKCQWQDCGWSTADQNKDFRFLEAHHLEHHAKGGANVASNLVTLCNLHHDEAHRKNILVLSAEASERLGL